MKSQNFKNKILFFKIKSYQDPESFGKIYDAYVDKIYRFVYFKVSNSEEAQDITSDIFLKTWQYIKEKKNIKNFNAFIYQIARNQVIDYYRKRAQAHIIEDDSVMNDIQDEQSKRDIKDIDVRLTLVEVEKLLLRLKDEYREVILLRYVEEFSIKEIAEIINKTPGATKVLLHRALKKIASIQQKDSE